MNVRLARWIKASVCNFFQTQFDSATIPLFITGDTRITEQSQNWVELRMNGPDLTQVTKDNLKMDLRLNFIVNLVDTDNNSYAMEDLTGQIASMITTLPIYRYGDPSDPQNDSSLIQCVEPLTEGNNGINIKNFGKLDSSTNLTQSTVEVMYKSYFGVV